MGHENLTRRADQPGRSSERAFGFVFGALFGIIGAWPLLHRDGVRMWAFCVALLMLAVSLWRPSLLAAPNRLWLTFGSLLHRVVSPLALALIFFLVVTPTGLLMRLFGKDPLRLAWDPAAKSYWIVRSPPGPRTGGMSDQF